MNKTIHVKVTTVTTKYYAVDGEDKGEGALTNDLAIETTHKREEMGAPMGLVRSTDETSYKVVKEVPPEKKVDAGDGE
jgi:hypothetical protein